MHLFSSFNSMHVAVVVVMVMKVGVPVVAVLAVEVKVHEIVNPVLKARISSRCIFV